MNSARFAAVREIFESALEFGGEERTTYLNGRCGVDTSLRLAVEELLEGDRSLQEGTAEFLRPRKFTLAQARLEPGAQLGGYRLDRFVASGGMGSVYEATQDHPRRKVALKVLRWSLMSTLDKQRFAYEAECLGRLQHPGIAQVFEARTAEDGTPFFAMEFVENGLPIHEFARAKNLTERERAELFVKVCDAVHHGHQRGVLHCDLKPGNILVGLDGRPRIIDFGIARMATEDSGDAFTGAWVGTLDHMSPEQLTGSRHDLDTRTDVYSLGVVLFELLSGGLPRDGGEGNLTVKARRLAEQDARRLRSVSAAASIELDWICGKALETERIRRYASASDLGHDLERFLARDAVEAGPPGTAYRVKVFSRRHRAIVGSVAAVILALTGGLGGLWWGYVKSQESEVVATLAKTEAVRRAEEFESMFDFVRDLLIPREQEGVDEPEPVEKRLAAGIARLDKAFPGKPEVVSVLREAIGTVYASLGFMAQAEPIQRVAYQQLQSSKGIDDPETVRAAYHLALTLLKNGKHAEAAPLLLLVRDAKGKDGGPVEIRPFVRWRLFDALMGAGRLREAATCIEDLLTSQRVKTGPENPQLGRIEMTRAQVELYTGRFAAAETRLRGILEPPHLRWTVNDRRLLDIQRLLALCAIDSGNHEVGLTLSRQILDKQIDAFGVNDSRTPAYQAVYGHALAAAGRTIEATDVLDKASRALTRSWSEIPTSVLFMQLTIARHWIEFGRAADAEVLLRKSLDAGVPHLGEMHPVVLEMRIHLGRALLALGNGDEGRARIEAVKQQLDKVDGDVDLLKDSARKALGR